MIVQKLWIFVTSRFLGMGQILLLSLYFSFDVQNHWFVFLDSKGLVSGENLFTWMSFIKAFFVKCLMHFFGFGVVGKLI